MMLTNDKVIKRLLKLNPQIKPEDLKWRFDGRLEWICSHKYGHTIYDPCDIFSHGCDGCCCEINPVKLNDEEDS